ncbi:hypothetical protein TBLA_0E03880 [Henningerozyma blattae CBS 6284]|uniref:Tyrosine specific protein phosphatases domain-containing protein n=1 Tax=Henningerozyma blattae (strain ATCC 34711 / CBS 6284 / DSM 70876 / NBRC 10599 / NRRL Y-10934 / UCD 77-7) TaxID=1071380 RepID=I2H4Z1_HENB6|nr:hypothetical protein TBLA_0E03880 [Tetrapisispora blattae CBS 6284]CCH61443.1 hypothetical protein TBLA_0E03880 [Tetrapisispora blattae CBS 6284]
MKPKYIPPLNFSPVVSTDVSLYRSGYPMPLNYSYIRNQLHLKTIIYVGDKEELSSEYSEFLKDNAILFHHVYMDSSRDVSLKPKMDKVLRLVLDTDNYPILIHSNKGKHRVGVVVGIIRKILQGWSIAGIYQEYGVFSGGLKGEVDLEYITMFETNLSIPKTKLPGFAKINLLDNTQSDGSSTDDNQTTIISSNLRERLVV